MLFWIVVFLVVAGPLWAAHEKRQSERKAERLIAEVRAELAAKGGVEPAPVFHLARDEALDSSSIISNDEQRSRETQAWARWLARSVDGVLMTPIVLLGFAALGVAVELGRIPAEAVSSLDEPVIAGAVDLLVRFVMFALWEPLFLANSGTTPGKWIMGIRVRRASGERLSIVLAFNRFVRVWFVGMGSGVPLLSLILMLVARSKLVSDGVTSWDQSLDCSVSHRRRHPLIWVGALVAVFGMVFAMRWLATYAEQG